MAHAIRSRMIHDTHMSISMVNNDVCEFFFSQIFLRPSLRCSAVSIWHFVWFCSAKEKKKIKIISHVQFVHVTFKIFVNQCIYMIEAAVSNKILLWSFTLELKLFLSVHLTQTFWFLISIFERNVSAIKVFKTESMAAVAAPTMAKCQMSFILGVFIEFLFDLT